MERLWKDLLVAGRPVVKAERGRFVKHYNSIVDSVDSAKKDDEWGKAALEMAEPLAKIWDQGVELHGFLRKITRDNDRRKDPAIVSDSERFQEIDSDEEDILQVQGTQVENTKTLMDAASISEFLVGSSTSSNQPGSSSPARGTSEQDIASTSIAVIHSGDLPTASLWSPDSSPSTETGSGPVPSTSNVVEAEVTVLADAETTSTELDQDTCRMIVELSQDAKLSIPEDQLQNVVNLIHKILRDPAFDISTLSRDGESTIAPSRKQLREALRRVCYEKDILPSALSLTGVECNSSHVVRGGSYADIVRGKYDGQVVAIKRLRIWGDSKKQANNKMLLQREALIWSLLSHDHVVPFLGTDTVVFSPSLSLILPWMVNGNCMDFLEELKVIDQRDGLQDLVHKWIYQVALGLEYLHSEDVVHGDLRGPNILVDQDENIRLADFGLARLAVTLGQTMTSGGPTNAQWAAPETLWPEAFETKSGKPAKESDVYSFACICIELYTAEPPFARTSVARNAPYMLPSKIVSENLRPDRPTFCVAEEEMPDGLWSIITQSWTREPSQRLTAADIVSSLAKLPPHTPSDTDSTANTLPNAN